MTPSIGGQRLQDVTRNFATICPIANNYDDAEDHDQRLSAPQRCNAQRSDAQRKFFTTLSISLFLLRHRCDALPCFLASPVEIFYIAHIAFRPLLPIFLSPQWFTVQNNKKLTKSHNAAMSPLATRDGQRKRKRKRSDAVH